MLKPAEFFIVNLAISDLSMTVTLFPLATSSFFAHRYLVEAALHRLMAPSAICKPCFKMGRSLTGVWGDPRSQSGVMEALCNLTDTHPTAGWLPFPPPYHTDVLYEGFGGGFLSWHPHGTDTTVVCAAADQGSSCTPGSICACHWDAQGAN